ncbi:MFS transporter [Thermocladium modestius]|nr:MFS transporter [Thermocladium modestius]
MMGTGSLGETRWNREHTLTFLSASLGFLMWGFVTTMGVASLSWFKGEMPAYMIPVYPAIGPLVLLIGNQVMGRIADLVGRRRVFVITMSLYAVGLLGMAVAGNLTQFVAAYVLAEFGVGGEEPASLAALTEIMPANHRGKALVLATNFDNVGAALASGIVLAAGLYSIGFGEARIILGAAGAAVIGVAALARHSMPESSRWLMAREKSMEPGKSTQATAGRRIPLWLRLLVLGAIGISQIVTYGLIAFYLAYYYYTSIITISSIIMIANLGAAAAGLIGFAMDRIGRKGFTLFSYIGGALSMIPIIFLYKSLGSSILFYVFLFINMMFSEFSWAVRTMLEPELFKTIDRATFIGLVRVIAWSAYISSLYLSYYLSEYYYLVLNLAFYVLGAAGAITWFIAGIETKGTPLEKLEESL